ncbi:MAG: redoxin domain-containing protein [Gemmataceae bacterium]|nr:redoxin domain-containing protein [Gemmataceae bacterium]
MKTSFLLLACACSLGQTNSRSEWQLAPRLAPGQELVYAGVCVEESLVPNVQFQRQYRLETLVFVLDGAARRWNVAVMTALSQRTTGVEPGVKESKTLSVRLDVVEVNAQGKLTQGNAMPLLPLSGPPTLETGCFVEVTPPRLTRGSLWEVNEDNRPPRTWKVAGIEPVNGVTCVKVVGQQQSPDWDRPRGDQTAWRRRDVVWISPQLGVAQKVERVIEQRAPLRRDPTQRIVVQYELESPLRYAGRLFEDRKQEILKARKFQEDAAVLVKQPAQNRAQLEALLKKVSFHLDNQAPTPYRKAVFHLAGRLENAKNGNVAGNPTIDENPRPVTAVGLGQRVPDFVVNELTGKQSARLARQLGRPVLVFFYVPTSDIGKEILRFAKGLMERHGDKVAVMAMAVTNDPDFARKQHGDLQLPFPVLDGGGMRLTFGVSATPRLVLLDPEGYVRAAHTGWGFHVPREIEDELNRWLRK